MGIPEFLAKVFAEFVVKMVELAMSIFSSKTSKDPPVFVVPVPFPVPVPGNTPPDADPDSDADSPDERAPPSGILHPNNMAVATFDYLLSHEADLTEWFFRQQGTGFFIDAASHDLGCVPDESAGRIHVVFNLARSDGAWRNFCAIENQGTERFLVLSESDELDRLLLMSTQRPQELLQEKSWLGHRLGPVDRSGAETGIFTVKADGCEYRIELRIPAYRRLFECLWDEAADRAKNRILFIFKTTKQVSQERAEISAAGTLIEEHFKNDARAENERACEIRSFCETLCRDLWQKKYFRLRPSDREDLSEEDLQRRANRCQAADVLVDWGLLSRFPVENDGWIYYMPEAIRCAIPKGLRSDGHGGREGESCAFSMDGDDAARKLGIELIPESAQKIMTAASR